MWYGNDVAMEDEAKYEITVSEDKLNHKVVIKDLDMADQGTITAIAGIVPSKASLVVIGKILLFVIFPELLVLCCFDKYISSESFSRNTV